MASWSIPKSGVEVDEFATRAQKPAPGNDRADAVAGRQETRKRLREREAVVVDSSTAAIDETDHDKASNAESTPQV
jgi:hypothetical protein